MEKIDRNSLADVEPVTKRLVPADKDSVNRLYHYTTIDVLALILKNNNIRFNRLDKVDDIEEANIVSNGVNLSKYTFVSCWTKSSEENIPLWKLYSGGCNGVRISFEKDFFEEYTIFFTDTIPPGRDSMKSILPVDKMYCESTHLFMPCNSESDFYRPIEYVDDISVKTKDAVKQTENSMILELGEVGRYKHQRWTFQEESRFVLIAIPKDPTISMEHQLFSVMVARALKNNIELPFSEYYLKIKEDSLNKISNGALIFNFRQ